MSASQICGDRVAPVAEVQGVCGRCVRDRFAQAAAWVAQAHATARRPYQLPETPPRVPAGLTCNLCIQNCRIGPEGVGYCGLPQGNRARARVSWYYDPLPTNCVADFVCPGCTGCGYPQFAYRPGVERDYKSLAVFYEACSLDCLFCQNWSYRQGTQSGSMVSGAQLADALDEQTACVCFFGGDPTPQLPRALLAARLALARNRGRILRICWETNGTMHPKLLDCMVELALRSGGCIKFDLKAWHEPVHIALTGSSNRRTLKNFERVAPRVRDRPEVPLLVASTLLVPGYVDVEEVRPLARFIARLNPEIPYSLLAFAPAFLMVDLPRTSSAHMERCHAAAQEAGLRRIHIGNQPLLWQGDYARSVRAG